MSDSVMTENGEVSIPNYTGYGSAGFKYTPGLDVKEIAKRVRADYKAKYSSEYKFSVRIERFAGGQAIRVEIKEVPSSLVFFNKNYDRNGSYHDPNNSEYTKEMSDLLDEVGAMVDAYRRSDSDGMIDYFSTNFYSSTSYDYDLEKARRTAEGMERSY
jgi:hypothetical protein